MTYEGDIGFVETFYNVYACLRYQKPVESCISTAFVGGIYNILHHPNTQPLELLVELLPSEAKKQTEIYT